MLFFKQKEKDERADEVRENAADAEERERRALAEERYRPGRTDSPRPVGGSDVLVAFHRHLTLFRAWAAMPRPG